MSDPSARPVVLILGANGRLGAEATRAFAAGGWQVLAQARRVPQDLPSGARHIALELTDTAALAAAASGARAVVHAINPPYTRWATDALPLARRGMDVAARLDALFMLPGNVYNFGAGMPALLREDTPQVPTARKGRIRCDIEAEMAAAAGRGLRSVVIRAGDFFGAGTGTWFDLVLLKSLGRGKLVYPGPLDRAHAWAYLPDLARAFVAVADKTPDRGFSRLHFAGHTLTGAELLGAIGRVAAALGMAPAAGFRHGGLPWWVLRLGGAVVPMWRELVEMAYLWEVPHAVDGTALRALLGDVPATPIDAALAATLRTLAPQPRST